MRKVLEFEKHAAGCRQLAAKTSNQAQKHRLLEMADTWARLAEDRRTGAERPVNGHRPPIEFSDQTKAVE